MCTGFSAVWAAFLADFGNDTHVAERRGFSVDLVRLYTSVGEQALANPENNYNELKRNSFIHLMLDKIVRSQPRVLFLAPVIQKEI